MDISYDNDEIIRKCFKCEEPVFENLNVIYNASSTTITLWNKFQIFVYENLEFECASRVIIPEFQISNILTSSNYMMCVDYAGNVHTTSMKFKSAASKRFKSSFQPRELGVMASADFGEDFAICLKYESDAYFLSVHKITTEFNLEKIAIVVCKEDLPLQQNREKYILRSCPITANNIEYVKKVLNIEDINLRHNYSLVVMSFDQRSIYCCLFSTKMAEDEVNLVKLYCCPADIAGIEYISSEDFNILIGLKMGTVISLNFKEMQSPQVIHLNTAIHKIVFFGDTTFYTDGITMWKAENILSNNVKFSQLFIKNVKDFTKFGDQLICTTFNNIIYTFSKDDDRSYVKPQTVDEYCSAEKLFDNSDCLTKILEELEKNKTIIKMLTIERNYITALSLSNRQDVMDNIIKHKVIVYENYEDALSENAGLILTNTLSEYFDAESFYFLIKITVTTDHRLHEILSQSLGDLRVHITLVSEGKVVKTTTIKVKDLMNSITFLVPLKNKFISTTEMQVNFKIITNIPGALDAHQKLWTVLYRKCTTLHSEHFIKFNLNRNKNMCLREPKESLEELILETAMNQYGDLIECTDITKVRDEFKKWHMYVRLPDQYHNLSKYESTAKYASKKVNYFLQRFTSDHFLKSQSSITLSIGQEKVDLEIDNDGFSTPSLKVTSNDVQIALNIRNFLSDLIYYIFGDFEPGKEFISHSFYVTVEVNILFYDRHYYSVRPKVRFRFQPKFGRTFWPNRNFY